MNITSLNIILFFFKKINNNYYYYFLLLLFIYLFVYLFIAVYLKVGGHDFMVSLFDTAGQVSSVNVVFKPAVWLSDIYQKYFVQNCTPQSSYHHVGDVYFMLTNTRKSFYHYVN